MPNKNKMKSLNLSGAQAEIVVKSLNERLYEFDEELEALENRMKKNQLNNLLVELGSPSSDSPKKRGRKPGPGKNAAADTDASSSPKKRGRKPGSGNKAAAKATAAPQKRGRKPAAAGKPETAPDPVKNGAKTAPQKSAAKTAPKAKADKDVRPADAGKKAAPAKKEAAAKTAAPKAAQKKSEGNGKRGRKSGGENTLAAKIVSGITDAKKGLSTREIVDSITSRFGPEKDERKLIQAVSSTLISLTKRGKIKRETGPDGQILNIVVS